MKSKFNVFKLLITFFKVGVSLYLAYFIYTSINWTELLETAITAKLSFIVLGFLIMIPNIFFDWLKWDYMVRLIDRKISKAKTFKSVLSGLTLNTVFNNPIADYGGRILALNELPKGSLVAFHFFEKTQLLVVNVMAGSVSLVILGSGGYFDPAMSSTLIYIGFGLGGFSFLSGIVLTVPKLYVLFVSIFRKIAKKYIDDAIASVSILNFGDSLYILFINLLKVVTFNIQFYAVLLAFGFVNIYISFLGSTGTLMVKWVLEGLSFSDIGIRGAASVFFFTKLGVASAVALNTAMILVVINRIFPSIIGALVFLGTDFKSNSVRRSVRLYRLQRTRKRMSRRDEPVPEKKTQS